MTFLRVNPLFSNLDLVIWAKNNYCLSFMSVFILSCFSVEISLSLIIASAIEWPLSNARSAKRRKRQKRRDLCTATDMVKHQPEVL